MAVTAVLGLAGAVPAGADPAPGPSARAAQAWSWIEGQMGTGTAATGDAGLVPDEPYPASWTGPVSGTVVPGTEEGAPLTGLVVEVLVVTDREYDVGTAPVAADGTFSFPYAYPGTKVFRLVDADGAILAEHAPPTGLLRSFDAPRGSHLHGRVFSYDQALALLAALSMGEEESAATLAEGLLSLQQYGGAQDGGFVTSAASLYPEGALREFRTGNHAMATYALLRYLATLPEGAWRDRVADSAARAVDWLLAQRAAGGPLEGLVTGGHGAYTPDWRFDADAALPWASTEHNLDAWHALRLAGTVLGDPAASSAADSLGDAVADRLWDADRGRFLQGRSPDGPDLGEALDVNSWGAIFLAASGRTALAGTSLARASLFASSALGTAGHAPVPSPSPPLVWAEGTAGVALAQLRTGDAAGARATLEALAGTGAAEPRGTARWAAASREDEALSMTATPAIGAAAWVLLVEQAAEGQPSLWDESTGASAP
ncbi:hypothetical protein [Rothia santali]|uniref:hypothetical protein n=1 Tax=Rothia santali TaxID=2949643 RepID=UPI002664EA53|nr:hypothetical protein [Rothia santali]